MLPGRRTDNGAIFIAQGPAPAGTPLVAGIAVSPAGVIYVSQALSPVWSPIDLFLSGEQGAWYDPSDLSTMFQDIAGTTPVTGVGQPVGLILDKSQGLVLGPELITNVADREFTSDTGFWSKEGSATISGGVVNINNPSGTAPIYKLNFPNEPGGYYKIEFDLVLTGGSVEVVSGAAVSPPITTSGHKVFQLNRVDVNTFGIRAAGSTATGTLDNLSIKRIAGNHASQATAAARPMLAATGICDWTNYDAVDDVLNTAFPSALGSSCTVARANVGAAPTILTAQTIGTSYADSTDNAGLIIVNRALTTQETIDLTAWLTAKGATA